MIGKVVYVSVGLLFWVTIGVYIVMGTGKTVAAKKRQVVGAAPELVSEAGEPILCRFWEHTTSPLRRLPKPLLEARSRFLACCQGAM